MADTGLQRFGLAGLARATQASLDWRNWGLGAKRSDLDDGPSRESLDKLIEAEIIPRLMLTHRDPADAGLKARVAEGAEPRSFDAAEVDAFARKAITSGAETLVDEIEIMLHGGAAHEDVLLRLLAPAARRLGRLWEEDEVDFADVTIGLMKLHRVLERVNADTPCGLGAGGVSPRVLLSPAPGEQHVFGVVMVGEFFARSGWRVRCESAPTCEDLAVEVADNHYDVVGLSASCDITLKSLREAIRIVRTASQNPDVVVLVGGPLINEDVGLARRIGADATATDGVRAVVTAERLVHRRAHAENAVPPQ